MKTKFIPVFILIALSLFLSPAFAIQDEMAVGKFSPGDSKFQLVIFHFSRGKTFFKFFENPPDSRYLFPTFEVLVKGQLLEKPVIEDINGDELLDITYKTTSEQGVVYFNLKKEMFIKTPKEKLKKADFTIRDEMNLFDNDTRKK